MNASIVWENDEKATKTLILKALQAGAKGDDHWDYGWSKIVKIPKFLGGDFSVGHEFHMAIGIQHKFLEIFWGKSLDKIMEYPLMEHIAPWMIDNIYVNDENNCKFGI